MPDHTPHFLAQRDLLLSSGLHQLSAGVGPRRPISDQATYQEVSKSWPSGHSPHSICCTLHWCGPVLWTNEGCFLNTKVHFRPGKTTQIRSARQITCFPLPISQHCKGMMKDGSHNGYLLPIFTSRKQFVLTYKCVCTQITSYILFQDEMLPQNVQLCLKMAVAQLILVKYILPYV